MNPTRCQNVFHNHRSARTAAACRRKYKKERRRKNTVRHWHENKFKIAYEAIVLQHTVDTVCTQWKMTRTQLDNVLYQVVRQLVGTDDMPRSSWRYGNWWSRSPYPITELRGDLELILKLKKKNEVPRADPPPNTLS